MISSKKNLLHRVYQKTTLALWRHRPQFYPRQKHSSTEYRHRFIYYSLKKREKITHKTILLQERIHTPAPNQKSTKPGNSQSRRLQLFPLLYRNLFCHLLQIISYYYASFSRSHCQTGCMMIFLFFRTFWSSWSSVSRKPCFAESSSSASERPFSSRSLLSS